MKACSCYFLPALLVAGFFLEATPRRYDDDLWIQIKEIRDTVDDLRREVNNHESEIRTFEQKASTQEDRVDTLQKELKETHLAQKDLLKNNQGSLDAKLSSLEMTNKGLVQDLKNLKNYSQETQDLLKVYRDKIATLEKSVEGLTSAMNSLMDAIKVGSGSTEKVYRVKPGDSLEKIAKNHGTTIRALKELNGLTKDTITIGQVLKLP